MIAPSPTVVRTALARYAAARIAHEEAARTPHAEQAGLHAQELADASYTLCVLTGARSVSAAIAAADALLQATNPGSHTEPGPAAQHTARRGLKRSRTAGPSETQTS